MCVFFFVCFVGGFLPVVPTSFVIFFVAFICPLSLPSEKLEKGREKQKSQEKGFYVFLLVHLVCVVWGGGNQPDTNTAMMKCI